MLYPVLQDPLHPIVSSLFDRPVGVNIRQMLFGAGEQGGWYDVADMSTLFQDSAGATPVTAVEQQVGRMLDKSGRGNHATQATTTKRPVLSRRVNLLTKTEQFSDAVWVLSNLTVTPSAAAAPDGSLTAAKIAPTASSGSHTLAQPFTGIAGEVAINAIAKADAAPIICIRLYDALAGTGFATYFNLLTGTVGTNAAGNTATITPAGNGYYTCTVRRIALGGASSLVQLMPCLTDGSYNYSGDGASGIFVWSSSLTLATDAHLPYQRVNTATDYDADPAKFPAYLRLDGVDDALQTGNIDFTGTDKMTVCAGINSHKAQNGSSLGTILIHPDTSLSSYVIYAPSGSQNLSFAVLTSAAIASAGTVTAVATNNNAVVTAIGDLASRTATLRVNGADIQTSVAASGGGNFRNGSLYIGGQSVANRHFDGRLYSLIVRGAQTPLSQIEATELYIKQKMRLP